MNIDVTGSCSCFATVAMQVKASEEGCVDSRLTCREDGEVLVVSAMRSSYCDESRDPADTVRLVMMIAI